MYHLRAVEINENIRFVFRPGELFGDIALATLRAPSISKAVLPAQFFPINQIRINFSLHLPAPLININQDLLCLDIPHNQDLFNRLDTHFREFTVIFFLRISDFRMES